MSDKKLLNKVKEFSQYLDHKHDIERFKLKESYAQSLLVIVTIGGSTGGDCWGGRTSDYDVDDSEIVSNLVSSITYILKNYFSDYLICDYNAIINEHLSNISRYDYIAHGSDYCDYYGNHSDEGIFEIPVYPLLKLLIDDEYFQMLKSYLSNEKKQIEKVFVDRKTAQRIEEINKKINSFEDDKTKELASIKENIKRYESILKSLKEDANSFATKKTQELKTLKEELKKLES